MSKRDERTQSFWDLHDFAVGRGVEIGPLYRPLVHRNEADVSYVDIRDQKALQDYYAADPSVPVDEIPEIDYPLIVDGVVRSLPEVVGVDAPFSWVMASHVIEHVPNLIGWLSEVAEVVEDGGALVLAVPDKRYTFDLHRAPTTVGAMLQAVRQGDTVPSVRAVYDHFNGAITAEAAHLWGGARPDYSARMFDTRQVWEQVEQAEESYVDCHVWIFTPELFLAQMHELRRAGLSSWYVDLIHETPEYQLEFQARLRRVSRGADATAAEIDGEILPTEKRPHWMEEAAAQDAEIARLRAKVRRQRRQNRRQRERLKAVESSRRWRLLGALLAPVTKVRHRLSSERGQR